MDYLEPVADFFESLGEGLSSLFGGKSKKLGFDIPGLASGGIVTRPTITAIGEKGPEAVIPLGKMGGIGGPNIVVNIDNIYGVDPDQIVDAFQFKLRRLISP